MKSQHISSLFDTFQGGKALLIGNGVSRAEKNLSDFSVDATFGCNLLFQDFFPTYLITQNIDILERFIRERVYVCSKIIYRDRINVRRISRFMNDDFYYLEADEMLEFFSGIIMAYLISKMGFNEVIMVGMDMNDSNLYYGCPGYLENEESRPEAIKELVQEQNRYLTFIQNKNPHITWERR